MKIIIIKDQSFLVLEELGQKLNSNFKSYIVQYKDEICLLEDSRRHGIKIYNQKALDEDISKSDQVLKSQSSNPLKQLQLDEMEYLLEMRSIILSYIRNDKISKVLSTEDPEFNPLVFAC
jgi:hypothetical protein